MPTYSYHCENCDHTFDEVQSFNDSNLVICPACSQETLHRIYRPAQVVFKGSGYYVTDAKGKKATLDAPPKAGESKEKSNGKKEVKNKKKDSTKKSKKKSKKKR